MTHLEFDQIRILVNRNDHPFKSDLIEELKGLVLVRPYFEREANIISDTYSTRYHINQTITHFDGINGWLPLIPNLDRIAKQESKFVRVIGITTEQNQYLHFTSPDMKDLYGVLQFTEENIDRNSELTAEGKLRGTWTDCVFYDNGIIVENGS